MFLMFAQKHLFVQDDQRQLQLGNFVENLTGGSNELGTGIGSLSRDFRGLIDWVTGSDDGTARQDCQ